MTRFGIVFTGDMPGDTGVLAPEAGFWCETYQEVGSKPACYQWYTTREQAEAAIRKTLMPEHRAHYHVAELPQSGFEYPEECGDNA